MYLLELFIRANAKQFLPFYVVYQARSTARLLNLVISAERPFRRTFYNSAPDHIEINIDMIPALFGRLAPRQ